MNYDFKKIDYYFQLTDLIINLSRNINSNVSLKFSISEKEIEKLLQQNEHQYKRSKKNKILQKNKKERQKQFDFEINPSLFKYLSPVKSKDSLKKLNKLKKRLMLRINQNFVQFLYYLKPHKEIERELYFQNHCLYHKSENHFFLDNKEKWDLDFDEDFEYVYPLLLINSIQNLNQIKKIKSLFQSIEFLHDHIKILHHLPQKNTSKRRQLILQLEQELAVNDHNLKKLFLKNLNYTLQRDRGILWRRNEILNNLSFLQNQNYVLKMHLAKLSKNDECNSNRMFSYYLIKLSHDISFKTGQLILNSRTSHLYFKNYLKLQNEFFHAHQMAIFLLNSNEKKIKKTYSSFNIKFNPEFNPFFKKNFITFIEKWFCQLSSFLEYLNEQNETCINNTNVFSLFYQWNNMNFILMRQALERIYYKRLDLLDEASQLLLIQAKRKSLNLPEFFDLVRDGVPWILHALYKFDTERQTSFLTYSKFWIRHGIQTSIAQKRYLIRMPQSFYKKQRRDEQTLLEKLKEDVFFNIKNHRYPEINYKLQQIHKESTQKKNDNKFLQIQSIEGLSNTFDEDSEILFNQIKDNRIQEKNKISLDRVNQKNIIANFAKSLTDINKFFLFTRTGTNMFEKHNRKKYKILFNLNFQSINYLDLKFEKIAPPVSTKSNKK